MKAIKPQKLGLLTRVFLEGRDPYLVVTAFAFFPFDSPKSLGSEVSMWKLAARELGKDAALDLGMPKPRGELLVTGRGYPRGGSSTACSVRVKIASIDKELWVVGDRQWKLGGASLPEPFSEIPVTWANAFGGPGYAPNPLGKGHARITGPEGESHPLPNVEDPKHLVGSPNERPAPAGFGAYDLTWPQRFPKMGTQYDEKWLAERYPGFATDFDVAFFSSAPLDQQIAEWFAPDEAFTIENMHPDRPLLEGRLPGLTARALINQRTAGGEVFRDVPMRLDTVHLFPHAERGIVTYRGVVRVAEDDAADVLQILAALEDPGAPRSIEHYREVLALRLDRKRGYLHALRDGDLLPGDSEGALPDDISDVKHLMAHENLLRKNMRRRIENEREKARSLLVAQGLDPAQIPEQAPDEPVPRLDQLGALVDKLETDLETQTAAMEKQRAAGEREARQRCAELGLDYDAIVLSEQKKSGGPPKFSAKAELEKLRATLQLSLNAGVPLPHIEAQLADPALPKRLEAAEKALFDAYRLFGHYQDPAARLDADAAARLKAEVLASVASKESFAGRDLTGADLSGMDLTGADLREVLLESANLAGTIFTDAALDGAMLARADLTGARLDRARMAGANLGAARLQQATFTGADLTRAVLTRADLTGADFTGASLHAASFLETIFGAANLSGIKAGRLNFMKSDLAGVSFAGAELTQCNFLQSELTKADFTGAKLVSTVMATVHGDSAIFRGVNAENLRVVKDSSFEGADFTGAFLPRSNFRATRLAGADFTDATLDGADLSEADLRGARLHRVIARSALFLRTDLRAAVLVSANLMEAIFQKAKIQGADFLGANLYGADLMQVEVDRGTNTKDANLTRIRFVQTSRPDE